MKMKSLLKKGFPAALIIAGSMTFANQAFAQLKVGDNPLTIDGNSALEVEATNKGIRYPRVELLGTNLPAPLTAHVKGMHVYNTNETNQADGTAVTEGVYLNNGSVWQLVSAGVIEEKSGPDNPPPASECVVTGTIYTYLPDDENDPNYGKQFRCKDGAWSELDPNLPSKNTGPFYVGIDRTKKVDAGNRKLTAVWRGGAIKIMNAPPTTNPNAPNNTGSSFLTPGGVLQLYRGSALSGGAYVAFTNTTTNAAKFSIEQRVVADALAIQTRPTATAATETISLFYANGNVVIPSLASGSKTFSVGGDGTGNINQGQGSRDGMVVTYGSGGGSNASIQNSGTGSNLFLSKAAGSGSDAVFIHFRANGTDLGHIMRDGADNKVRFVGNVTGISTPPSDRRLKENITETHYSIADLMKIEVKDYNFKADKNKKSETGFIAQDLYKILPYAVHVGGADEKINPWAVNYAGLTPVLVKAIQEQQKEIAALKAQLLEMNSLKEEVASIKSLLGKAEMIKDMPAK